MALGDPYATLTELKSYVGIAVGETLKDEQLGWALDSASREIEDHCERQFNKETSVSQRIFRMNSALDVEVDDFHTTSGLVIETGISPAGSWSTLADYQLCPLNGIVNGVPGWPYTEIESAYGTWFPCFGFVRVTAQWGWPSVPDPVHQACLLLAAKNYKLADAPMGVAGFGEFGVVRVKDIPEIACKLRRYKRIGVHVG